MKLKVVASKFAIVVGFLITLTLLVGGFSIADIALFKWILLVQCVLCLLCIKKIKIKRIDYSFMLVIISIAISILGAKFSGYIDISFIIGNFINVVLIAITVKLMEDVGNEVLLSFIKGIELSCYFQGVYCIAQALFRMMMGYSLNRFLFVQILHISDDTTIRDMISEGVYVEYGMNLHPSVLIPVIIIMMCFCRNKSLSIVLSLFIIILSRNSTAVIAYVLCLILPWLISRAQSATGIGNVSKIKKKSFIWIIIGIAIGCTVLISTGLYEKLLEVVNRTWIRIISNVSATDYSTRTHALYYTSISDVLSRMKIFNILFGNGFDSSGDVITHTGIIFNSAKNWAIEADPVNILYGVGIFGVVIFYNWLLKGIKKSFKWNSKFFVFAITVVICGITYRIQYLWFIMFELVLFRLIANGVDITDKFGKW